MNDLRLCCGAFFAVDAQHPTDGSRDALTCVNSEPGGAR